MSGRVAEATSASDEPPPRTAPGLRASVRVVFSNPSLRRVQLALAGSSIGDWAYMTAMIVWAYDVGGPGVVGTWVAIRYLLMAVFASPVSGLADHLSRRVVMVGADLLRAGLVAGAAACVFLTAPVWSVFVLATLSSIVGTAFRPAQLAWMPDLVERPEELTTANGVASTFDSLAFFIGPALAGLLLTVTDVSTVFALNVVTFLWSAVLVGRARARTTPATDAMHDDCSREGAVAMLLAGFTTIRRDRDLVMVVALVAAQSFVAGAEYVFAVSIAVEILLTGPEGLGYLEATLGVGAIVGGAVAIARAAKGTLGRDLYTGVFLWSFPVLLVAASPTVWMSFAALAVIGFANPFVDVNYATLLQRIAPGRVLGRVFGVTESVVVVMMAFGSMATPLLIELGGLRVALVCIGLFALTLSLPWWWRVKGLDARLRAPHGLGLMSTLDLFRPLPPAMLETLAGRLHQVTATAGEVVVEEGGVSDRFFVIESGGVEVTQRGDVLRQEGPGEYFGEIGLLRDVPRTATVTATEDTVLLSLDRADFLAAVTGNAESFRMASDVASRRMAV